MARNGSGSYSLPSGNPVVTGQPISSSWANSTLSDIATALTNSIAKNGETTVTGNLLMGGFKLTGLAAGTVAGDSVRYEQVGSLSFPSGTKMLFQQTAAPTGWTKDTTHNDKALRVVSGTASSGGSVAFSTAFASQAVSGTNGNTTATGTVDSHTLTVTEIPSHTHDIQGSNTGGGALYNLMSDGALVQALHTQATVATGGGGGHTHPFTGVAHTHTFTGTAINLAVQYVDLIIATKD